ncbi:hypothetical protein IAT40_007834 [Kwoniella sp. CBS 6097]
MKSDQVTDQHQGPDPSGLTVDHNDHEQHEPMNLADAAAAAAVDIASFAIDPALSVDLFADPTAGVVEAYHNATAQHAHTHAHEHGHEHEPTQEDIHAVIQASLEAQAQAQANAQEHEQSQQEQQGQNGVNGDSPPMFQDAQADGQVGQQQPNAFGSGSGSGSGSDSPSTAAAAAAAKRDHGTIFDARPGEENEPITDPILHLAPFNKPARNESTTPYPEYYIFASREKFTQWLEAESSWCHYVQRRTTTPDKRSAERFQARIRAHNRQLEAMTPEERAAAPPLKTRRRNRVSPVVEKVTFTCHHAGSYESKHSSTLPKEKLRLNTKTSVKCACASRVVLSEMNGGECKVVYHWKHEGHDPFSDEDTQGGRLPKAIDVWLNRQIEAGKTLDDIRKVLTIPDEEKQAYLTKVQADPTTVDPDMPPPLAMVMHVKYPDIYNRYRKLKGPVKEHKVLKSASAGGIGGGTKRSASGAGASQGGSGKRQKTNGNGNSNAIVTGDGDGDGMATSMSTPEGLSLSLGVGVENDSDGQVLDPALASSSTSSYPQEHVHIHKSEPASTDNNNHDHTLGVTQPDFSTLGGGAGVGVGGGAHEGLARALLELPSSGGLRDEDGNEMSLEEAMRRMAEGVQNAVHAAEVGVGIDDGVEMGTGVGVGLDGEIDVDVEGTGMGV